MKEGLYKVDFSTPMGAGYGLVVLKGGRIWGGDYTMSYVGTYSEADGKFEAKVKTAKHTSVPGGSSVFGRYDVNINLNGTVAGDLISASGTADEAPGVSFSANLHHLAD